VSAEIVFLSLMAVVMIALMIYGIFTEGRHR
jgi:hypothetical protein